MHKKSQFSVSREGVSFQIFHFLHHISTRENEKKVKKNVRKVTKKQNFYKFYEK